MAEAEKRRIMQVYFKVTGLIRLGFELTTFHTYAHTGWRVLGEVAEGWESVASNGVSPYI